MKHLIKFEAMVPYVARHQVNKTEELLDTLVHDIYMENKYAEDGQKLNLYNDDTKEVFKKMFFEKSMQILNKSVESNSSESEEIKKLINGIMPGYYK